MCSKEISGSRTFMCSIFETKCVPFQCPSLRVNFFGGNTCVPCFRFCMYAWMHPWGCNTACVEELECSCQPQCMLIVALRMLYMHSHSCSIHHMEKARPCFIILPVVCLGIQYLRNSMPLLYYFQSSHSKYDHLWEHFQSHRPWMHGDGIFTVTWLHLILIATCHLHLYQQFRNIFSSSLVLMYFTNTNHFIFDIYTCIYLYIYIYIYSCMMCYGIYLFLLLLTFDLSPSSLLQCSNLLLQWFYYSGNSISTLELQFCFLVPFSSIYWFLLWGLEDDTFFW